MEILLILILLIAGVIIFGPRAVAALILITFGLMVLTVLVMINK